MDNRTQIKKLLIALSAYYFQEIPNIALDMYVEDLADLSVEQVNEAVRLYRNPKNTRFPLPPQLRQLLEPAVNPDHEAIEASNRIWAAIGKYGWCNPTSARAYVGELAWAVVQSNGGWLSICEQSHDANSAVMKAQLRETAKAIYARSEQGMEAPALPKPKRSSGGLRLIGPSMFSNNDPEGAA